MTSNTKEGVQAFLANHQLQYFEFIFAPDSLFGKAKVIRKILSHEALSPQEVIMIGDELRDVEAANKAGVESIAVTWGFNTQQVLERGEPNHLIMNPSQLLELV